MTRRILAVARKEFRGFFDHATAYILLVVFLAANFFFYFRDLEVTGQATLRPMFDFLPWLFLFFVPAVTMRSLAEERSTGSLELTLSHPLREAELVAGKYLGVMGFLAVAVAGTLGAPLGLSFGADLQLGVAFAQYVGALLLAAGLAAVGVWASSMTENQITAFILALTVIFVLIAINLQVVLIGLPPELSTAAARLGALAHYENVTRGVIDLRDVIYFLTLGAGFLSLTYWSLMESKLSPERDRYGALRLGTGGLLGICIVVNLLGGHIRGRWDLTPGDVYTLSDATRAVIGDLDDVVTVKLFASDGLPPQVATVRRDVEDLLSDYRRIGGDRLRFERVDPGDDDSARQEARRAGVPPVQFNVLGEGEMQVKEGYLGLAIQYADDSESIPVIREASDLEYRLTRAIWTLTRESTPTVRFLTGHGEKSLARDLRTARQELENSYTVRSLSFPADTAPEPASVPEGTDVVVVAGPTGPVPGVHAAALKRYVEGGGSLLVLAEGMRQGPSPRAPATPLPPSALDSLIQAYGVRVVPGYAFDLRANEMVSMRGSGGMGFARPYPLWPVVGPASESRIVQDLGGVLLPWVSPLELTADSAAAERLLTTTRFAGRATGRTSLDPSRDWRTAADSLRPQLVAAAVRPGPASPGSGNGSDSSEADTGDGGPRSGADSGARRGRIVVVGDADFVTDRFLDGRTDNLPFFRNAVGWLAQQEALIDIRMGDPSPPRLVFDTPLERNAVKWGNLAGVPLLFVGIGVWRLLRRKRLQQRSWSGSGSAER